MSRSDRPFVFGAAGLLGRHVLWAIDAKTEAGVAHGETRRIHSSSDISSALAAVAPRVIINCIGYFGNDSATSWQTNAVLPRVIADWAAREGVPFLHVSTNSVFAPDEKRAWTPGDPIEPRSEYEVTKACGEDPRAYVLRSSFIGAGARRETVWDRMVSGAPITDRVWNGVTVLALAERIADLALADDITAGRRGLEHVHSPESTTLSDVGRLLESQSPIVAYRRDGRLLGGGIAMPRFGDQLDRYLSLYGRIITHGTD